MPEPGATVFRSFETWPKIELGGGGRGGGKIVTGGGGADVGREERDFFYDPGYHGLDLKAA